MFVLLVGFYERIECNKLYQFYIPKEKERTSICVKDGLGYISCVHTYNVWKDVFDPHYIKVYM